MSWLFSQALVVEYSAENCLDGEPSAQLSVMPTAHKFLHNGRTMDASSLSRYGLTCAVLTDGHGEALLMSYLAGFRAKTSVLPVKAKVSTGIVPASGLRWPGSLAKYDQDTRSWKTAPCLLLGDSEEFSATWPNSGMTRTGMSYPRQTLAPASKGNASGLWRTPSATIVDSKSNVTKLTGRTPKDPQVGLADQVVAADRLLWIPPTESSSPLDLDADLLSRGQMNPQWGEWLMGWIIGWTDLKPLGMDKFHQWRQQHSECFLIPQTDF
jgi:hypothetical protein